MNSSPKTPRRRRSSAIDVTSVSPRSNGYSPQNNNGHIPRRVSPSRRSSFDSFPSPRTPRPLSSHGEFDGFRATNGFGGASPSGNGLPNLADELARMDEDSEEEGDGREVVCNGQGLLQQGHENGSPVVVDSQRPSSSLRLGPKISRHRRKASKYGVSDYGGDSDLDEAPGISPSLEAGMAAVETLARRGTDSNGSDADKIVQRVADSLKDLAPQSSLEQCATRLVTTHTALSAHLTHQTRLLQTLSHPLFSPLSHSQPDISSIDDLIPLLSSLEPLLPALNPHSISMIHLHSSTTDLLSTLSALCDSLHMTRQTTSVAGRRLRAAREMVAELRREAEIREESVRWLEKDRWDDRLAGRECARVCGEVVGGFEDVCNGWRELLADGGISSMAEVEVRAG